MGFLATFKGYFGYTNIPFQVDHENSSFKGHGKLRNENIIIKLWRPFATNNLLVVHLSKLMKLA
jgi:hypothetical protein